MKPEDVELFRTLLKERTGLVLSLNNAHLLESRLTPLARKRGLEGLGDLAGEIRDTRDQALIREVTEARQVTILQEPHPTGI